MIANLIAKILVGIIGTWAASYYLEGVIIDENILTILSIGTVLGLLLFFIKPLLSAITLPLRMITLNLFTIVIIMALIWMVDIFFPSQEFEVIGLMNLFLYALMIWILEFITSFIKK